MGMLGHPVGFIGFDGLLAFGPFARGEERARQPQAVVETDFDG
jgi:hypothetical protein